MDHPIVRFRSAKMLRLEHLSSGEKELFMDSIMGLSNRSGDEIFLVPHRTSHSRSFSFDMSNGQDAAAAAALLLVDKTVANAKERLCDGTHLSEQTFFFNYFSHVYFLLGSSIPVVEEIEEMKEAILSIIRVGNCAQLMISLPWKLWGNSFNIYQGPELDQVSSLLDATYVHYSSLLEITREDLIALAGALACKHLGGPDIAWRYGRVEITPRQLPCWPDLSEFERCTLKCYPFDVEEVSSFSFSDHGWNEATKMSLERFEIMYAGNRQRFAQDFATAYTRLCEWRFCFPQPEPVEHIASVPQSSNEDLLKNELQVFGFAEARRLPVTDQWQDAVTNHKDQILNLVRNLTISQSSGKRNLHVLKHASSSIPDDFSFNLHNPLDRRAAIAAGGIDPNLFKVKPTIVPKHLTEQEFYFNYFSHVYSIRKVTGTPSCKTVTVVVGSMNPVKVNSTRLGFYEAFKNNEPLHVTFHSMDAPSQVSDQPMGDRETKRGALNRAMYCKENSIAKNAKYFIGIEGGLEYDEELDIMSCFAWIAVVTDSGARNFARTATFTIPNALVSLVKKGIELGRADDIVYGKTNSKQRDGTVGTLTGGVMDRTLYYNHAMILALAPFANPTVHF